MGKPTGFVEWPRSLPDKRDKRERIGDWREIYLPQVEDKARQQAGRCMDCGVPFCQNGCPLGNHIPDWNHHVYRGQWRPAWERLSQTNNFPEFTGRLCPAPCEAACVLNIRSTSAPVTIEHVELEIIERAFAEGWVTPVLPARRSGNSVGVVGSGPSGLAAAQELARAGHEVVVYEADDRVGGMLRYGIPDFKLEKWAIDRRLEQMQAEGVQFRTGVAVGETIGWRELRDQHDALCIAAGARRARDVDVPGRQLGGVVWAMDYLAQQNRVVAGDTVPAAERIDAAGKRVVILGGGDTGSDCFGTALRQGATHVRQIELLPAPPEERAKENPWPEWPIVFRTSSSQEEGGERHFALQTRRFVGEDQVRALELARVEMQTGPDGGKRLVEQPGSEILIPADLIVLAVGFTGPLLGGCVEELGIALNARGAIAVGPDFATSADGVFSAGDAMRGASLIVWAIADGRKAAAGIDRYLHWKTGGSSSSSKESSGP